MTTEHDDEILRECVERARRLHPASRDEVARRAVRMFRFAMDEADRLSEKLAESVAYALEHERLVERLALRWAGDLDPLACNRVTADGRVVSTLEQEIARIREQASIAATAILAGRPS